MCLMSVSSAEPGRSNSQTQRTHLEQCKIDILSKGAANPCTINPTYFSQFCRKKTLSPYIIRSNNGCKLSEEQGRKEKKKMAPAAKL